MEEAPVGFLSLRSSWPVLVGAPVGWISQLDFPTGFLNSISQLYLSVLCLDHSCESLLNSNPFSWGGCCEGALQLGRMGLVGWIGLNRAGGWPVQPATSGIAATGRESVPSESVRLPQPEF